MIDDTDTLGQKRHHLCSPVSMLIVFDVAVTIATSCYGNMCSPVSMVTDTRMSTCYRCIKCPARSSIIYCLLSVDQNN